MLERTVALTEPIDVVRTVANVVRGSHDPTCRIQGTHIWRASRSPAGPSTVHLEVFSDRVEAQAWGTGAEAALDVIPNLIGLNDPVGDFDPGSGVVAKIWRDFSAVRIPRSGAVAETLLSVILEQRVTTFEARRSQAQITARWGEPAPGPIDLSLPADPDLLANVAYYDLHVVGVEKKRADTVRRVAASAPRLDALASLPVDQARARLEGIAGVGPWSAATVSFCALGDSDAVPVGDVHLPRNVTFALTGEAVDDDDAMLEALAPYAGHRGRVIALIGLSGIHAKRQAPRYSPRDVRGQ